MWHLVDASSAQDSSNWRYSRIVLNLEDWALGFVQAFELLLALLGVGDHGAELVHVEAALVQAYALLHEECRAGGVKFDENGDDQKQGRENDERDRGGEVTVAVAMPGSYFIRAICFCSLAMTGLGSAA